MRRVKGVLLGSAAGIFTVGGAQAADLPTKAQPVEYVRACSLYGAGFWYVPGTDTCVKIGAFARLQLTYGASGGGAPIGVNNTNIASGDFGGANTRATNMFNFSASGAISLDMRQQTEYGTLRSYVDMGGATSSNAGGYGGPTVLGPLFPSQAYGNQTFTMDRAFIQFAGFTAGRIRSFFDLVNPGAYSLATTRLVSGDTGGIGIIGAAYTLQLGGGLSASFSLEDGGWGTGGRGRTTVNLAGGSLPIAGQDTTDAFGMGILTTDVKGQQMMDPVFNIRLDQNWGFVGASFALHDASGGYYGTGYQCATLSTVGIGGINTGLCNGGPNTPANSSTPYFPLNTPNAVNGENNGHPADKWGWATTLGATWVNAFGLPGDTFGIQGVYDEGAVGYATQGWGSRFIYGSGNNVGLSFLVDGIFNTNTPVYLTKSWSAVSYYEHVWTPQWRTSIYGGLLGTDWGAAATAQVCGGITYSANGTQLTGPVGFSGGTNAIFSNLNTPGLPTTTGGVVAQGSTTGVAQINNYKGNVTNCNPNSSWTQLGTRTMWNPVPDIDIGFDLSWVHLNTAFAGSANFGGLGTVFQSNALGRSSGGYNIDNQNSFAAMFRVQRNFLY
jgi:hypothetical protein